MRTHLPLAVGGASLLILVGAFAKSDYAMPMTLLGLSGFLLAMALDFEVRQVSAQDLVALALLGALAAASRVPFAAIPSLQPVTFLVMATSHALGRKAGFIVGALAAFLSNFYLGQGPWTPWQMMAWGLCGLALPRNLGKYGLSLYGLATGFLFGWWMNAWIALSAGWEASLGTWVTLNMASFPMDLTHGLGTLFFIGVFWSPLEKIFIRVQTQYGLCLGNLTDDSQKNDFMVK